MTLQKGVATHASNRMDANTKDKGSAGSTPGAEVAPSVLDGFSSGSQGGAATNRRSGELRNVFHTSDDGRKPRGSRTQSKTPRAVPPLSTLTIRPTVERLRELERKHVRAQFLLKQVVAFDTVLAAVIVTFSRSRPAAVTLLTGYAVGLVVMFWSRRDG